MIRHEHMPKQPFGRQRPLDQAGTLAINGIDVRRWLKEWLTARGEQRTAAGRPVALAAVVDERRAPPRTHGVGMTGAVECRYYGRDFTAEEMALLRALIAGPAQLSRRALSIEFCRRIGWLKPDGGLKDMMARVTMLAMQMVPTVAAEASRTYAPRIPSPQARKRAQWRMVARV